MIIEIPTAEGIESGALRLHFSAWRRIFETIFNFTDNHPSSVDPTDQASEWKEEWAEHVNFCQSDLQACLALTQQSNELALKSKICSVSPYLLLLGSDLKFKQSAQEIRFDDLPTLDAYILPNAVISLTNENVSDKFIERYNRLRNLRNKIMHLGDASEVVDPYALLHDLIDIYVELWPDRNWINDQMEFGYMGASQYYDDGSNYSIYSNLLSSWRSIESLLTKGEFNSLFGIAKSKRRYLCSECIENAQSDCFEFRPSEMRTAYLLDKARIKCIWCGSENDVARKDCRHNDCKGNVKLNDHQTNLSMCLTCGEEEEF